MKKSFILTLLTIITLGLFQPATALAEEAQKLPSGIERDQIGQKSPRVIIVKSVRINDFFIAFPFCSTFVFT